VNLRRQIAILALAIWGFVSLCAQTQTGKASYYAKKFNGARTASGERLHPDSMTCAHRTYPFGTKLKVTNVVTGKEIIVRVNDRGPYIRGRIIDLSRSAAQELGIIRQGIAMVKVEEVTGEEAVPYRDEYLEKLEMPDFEIFEPHFSLEEQFMDMSVTPNIPEIPKSSPAPQPTKKQQKKKK